ncbi:MAG: hypothetical protein HOP23_18295 [Methylococcaceae bacterium]|nr:hypothetical protein [Methylococcaceae bacterium]NOT13746.1 hypothetical protein [Methylococcaceae bacterium]
MTIKKQGLEIPLYIVENAQEIADQAHSVIYRTRALVTTAIVLSEGILNNSGSDEFMQTCLIYQLEAIQELLKKHEPVFSEAEICFSREKMEIKGNLTRV